MAATELGGYRSASEYCFRENQADAIVRAAAYHRRDYPRSVIWFPPREHAEVRQSIATPFRQICEEGLGALDRLPPELSQHVLLHLDMQSLFRFQQANRISRQTVHSLAQYQRVASHGLNLFCALLRTRHAGTISLYDFNRALCTEKCSTCGNFGGFMNLLTWNRCCFECLQHAPENQVQTLAAIRTCFNLSKAETCRLTSFKALAGIYSMAESVRKSRVTIASTHQAMRITGWKPHLQPADHGRSKILKFMGACALPYYNKRTGKVEHGISCAGCQLAIEKCIIGSRGEKWAFEVRDKVYAQHGFLDHFKWREQAQLLWTSSGHGECEPAELPEAARRGGYFSNRE